MLEIRELRKTYPAQGGPMAALDGVGFTVEAGTFVSVIGPSGAGKSTLLRCVTGQLRPDGGSILLDGTDMVPLRGRRMRRLQQKIGMIYQDFCLVGCATAEENVLNACLPELGPLSVLLGRFTREKRQAAFVIGIEQAFAAQLLLQLQEAFIQGPKAGRLHGAGIKLVAALHFIG